MNNQPDPQSSAPTAPLLDPWAETLPWDCLIRPTSCCSPTHDHTPMANQPCAVDDCEELLLPGEVCYAVTQLDRKDGREQWVCWRHIRPDDGPIRVPADSGQPTERTEHES